MKTKGLLAVFAGFCLTASAGTVTYTDQNGNNLFASASYSLTANNAKVITSAAFVDGNATTSAAETPSTPDMRLPNSPPDIVALLPGETLISAMYDLSYQFFLTGNRTVTNTGTPNRAQTNPVFGVSNQNLDVTLVFKDINGNTLLKLDVTSISSLDLLPYLDDNGPIESAFESTGIFLRTHIRADSAIFSADLSGYDPVNNPDRNVQIDYDLKEHLTATSSLTLVTETPEPATWVAMALGILGLAALGRRRERRLAKCPVRVQLG